MKIKTYKVKKKEQINVDVQIDDRWETRHVLVPGKDKDVLYAAVLRLLHLLGRAEH